MDSSESEDAQSISDKKKLKRNRTTTVSLACLKCKEKHLKCDGAFPCATCRKRNKECIYPEKPYKRGPTRGTIARLEKTINELNDELSKQVNSAKEWERKVFQLSTTSAETRDLLMSGHMVNAQQLNGYINVYMRQYYPWIQIKPPIVDVDQFYDENIDQQQLAVSKSMAMFGALMSTHENHSRDLSHEIRLIISSVFDTTSPYMAAVYFFLSRYFSVIGDFDKEEFYSQNTIMISEAVMKKFGKPVIHGIDLENLRKCAFLTSEKGLYNERGFFKRTSLIYYMNSPDINIVRNIITTMIHNKDKHLAWISGILFQRTWMSLMGQSDLSDLFARVNHNLKLLELIDFIMTYSVSEITKESLPDERIWLIRTDAMRAVFCLFNNYDEAADMFADRVLNQVAKFPPHLGTKLGSVFLYFVPIPVFMLAQVYLFKDERDKFKVALEVLNRYTSEFESVKDGVKLLEVQTEKITNEFPINMTWRLNFFLPKINLFRAATSTRLSADNPSLNTNMPYALATGTPSVSNGTTHSTPTNTNNSNPAAPNWQATNVPSNAGSFPNAGYYQPYNPYTAHGQGNSPPSTNQQQTRAWSGQGANSATNNNGYAYNNNPPGQHNNTSYNYSSSTYSSFKHEPQPMQQVDSNTNQRYL